MELLTSNELRQKFSTPGNYSVLLGLLCCSAGIGFHFWRQEQASPEMTLLGGRNMHFLPVTFSLVASFLSAFTLLGLPAEVYTQGTQFLSVVAFTPITAFVLISTFLPIFHNLQLPTSFHYLELRFSPQLRLLAAGFSAAQILFFISIVVYLPALALEQVTGVNLDLACVTIFVVCVFYTTAGGMKAVVWTDVFQLVFMFLSTGYIIVVATMEAGGPSSVFQKASQDGRVQIFNTSFDPRIKHTVWGATIGAGFQWLGQLGLSQMQVQRYLSMRSLGEARKAAVLGLTTTMILILCVGWMGLVLWAVYGDCDPIAGHQIKKADQLLPLLVLQVAGDIPCLPGLFMAGVFSGSLSTISSGLNSLAAIGLRDFLPSNTRAKMGDSWQALATKLMALGFGCVGYGLTFVIRVMPSMLEVGILITGVVAGPTVGLFIAGMFLPCVDSRGALIGFIGSSLITGWMAVGNFVYRNNRVNFSALPAPNSTVGCPASWGLGDDMMGDNISDNYDGLLEDSNLSIRDNDGSQHLDLYDVSSIWYSAIGVSLVLILALVSSCILPSKKSEVVDKELISPLIRDFLPSSSTSSSSSSLLCCISTYTSSSPFLPSFTKSQLLSTPALLPCSNNVKETEDEVEDYKKEEAEKLPMIKTDKGIFV